MGIENPLPGISIEHIIISLDMPYCMTNRQKCKDSYFIWCSITFISI